MASQPPRYVSLKDAADYVHCHQRTIRRHISAGKITAYRLGRLIRVDLNELDLALRPVPTSKVGASR